MLSLQEVSDRLELEDLVHAYSHAVDARDWDALDELFTPDATIDYTEMGGPRGDLASTKAFLAEVMPLMTSTQHLVATSRFVVDGDSATGRSICFNPMAVEVAGAPHTFFCGLWYRDTFVRTAAGWRFADRYEERSYVHNPPPGFPAAEG
ncbi:MAG TPA: nuclear transport factor 2 family protein [Acidimicrobiales bacterium]|nr:nuclear transport factor 2 family protein [Acidimicrobiales bacterium]